MVADLEQQIRRELPGLAPNRSSELRHAIERLIASLQPTRIFAFGSYARGDASDDSDVDLLVVVHESPLPAHQRDQMAYRAVGRHTLPMDIVVMTEEEFRRMRTARASLPAIVLREGRMLYAA